MTAAPSVRAFDGSAAEWNDFARRQRGFTHCQRHEWRDVIERVFGHECLYLAATSTDGLAAVLPLVRVKSALFGHYLVSMPFLNYGGPLGTDDGVAMLAREARRIAERDGARLLELRSTIPLPLDLDVSHRKITVLLDLASSADATFQRFDAKLRSQIRRPRKEGVTVRVGRDEVDPFHAVFAEHMRDLGTPALPRAFFRATADAFGDDVWFACAYLRGRPVACGCGFRFGSEFELTWAASLRAHNREAPNMLLYWSLMERAIEDGAARFNFGRCTPGGGTHRFKQQWGGRDAELWWYEWARRGRAATPSPSDSGYRWGPRVWRRLPLPVTNRLGPMIVRGIP